MKITFVTFHNWNTKRIGGFHKFAEAAAKEGHGVVFFSFARPYFIALKHEERLNRIVLKTLTKGKTYNIDSSNHKITNCTWPTFRIPEPLHGILPVKLNKWFERQSHIPFKSFNYHFLRNTDVFVVESCEGVDIIDLIRKYNPSAKIVYRPSDPMMIEGCTRQTYINEKNLLYSADMTYIVNKSGLELYRKKVPDFDDKVKYQILPNGVDTDKFKKKYPCPRELQHKNTFLYVGARDIEWDLIKEAAVNRPTYNFIIVCPEIPPKTFIEVPHKNITYVPGISPNDVPAWVTNADIIIIPNPSKRYKILPWGITAKYYQAMAANKPIVVYEDTDELMEYGINVAHDYSSFISYLDDAINGARDKEYDFKGNDWGTITQKFLESIISLSHA